MLSYIRFSLCVRNFGRSIINSRFEVEMSNNNMREFAITDDKMERKRVFCSSALCYECFSARLYIYTRHCAEEHEIER